MIGDNGAAPAWSPDGKRSCTRRRSTGEAIVPDQSGRYGQEATDLGGGDSRGGGVVAGWRVDLLPVAGGRHLGIWRMNSDGSNPVKLIGNVPPVDWAFDA